jgi:hypothetical protein
LRIKELKRKRTEISQQIKEIESGEIPMLDGREIRERFIQFSRTSRELLGDFRAVEHNFRELDHSVREQIASWTGEKGELLGAIFGKQDSITQSEQGLSFRAFWDFLMSSGSQDELSMLLDKIFELEELKDLTQDNRLRRIHFDWINAGEQTQRMVARLSRQLRRYLDDRSYYENKRIVSLLDNIDQNALTVRESSPQGVFFNIDGFRPNLQVPMERPLYSIPVKVELDSLIIEGEDTVIDTSVLYNQIVVDKLRLQRNIKKELADQSQVSLGNLLLKHPLEEGLAELITYFTIAEESSYAVIDDQIIEKVFWIDHIGRERSAKVPKILFQRKLKDDK